ncbi:MAG: hypothetical protein ACK40G_09780 [Cytophagaceae bacterium]
MRFLINLAFFLPLTLASQSLIDYNLDYAARGYIYVRSEINDTLAPRGFGQSGPLPERNHGSFNNPGFYIFIDTTSFIPFQEKFKGFHLYIINNSDSLVKLNASDSRLSLFAEAFVYGHWSAIEYLPKSFCGNSFHRVYLPHGKYWKVNIPKYSGKIPVKIRYKLVGTWGNTYSNEYSGSINKSQLKLVKEGHKPTGIMDPYLE